MSVRDCFSIYELPNWYLDGKSKFITCWHTDDGHEWHQCDGYRWKTEDQFVGVPLKNVTIIKSNQVGGNHYEKMAIQPWEVIARANLDFWEGNVIKYIMRYRAKNGLEDLEKARHYLDYLIEREKQNAE